MDDIYNTHQNKYASLFRIIRSTTSCCNDYYINLCFEHDFPMTYFNYENEIMSIFYSNLPNEDILLFNIYYSFHSNLHKYVNKEKYNKFQQLFKFFF